MHVPILGFFFTEQNGHVPMHLSRAAADVQKVSHRTPVTQQLSHPYTDMKLNLPFGCRQPSNLSRATASNLAFRRGPSPLAVAAVTRLNAATGGKGA